MDNVLLSICIATRNRAEILAKTLNSIFESNVPKNDYEVVIYDSSDNDLLENIISKDFKQYPNLRYVKGVNNGVGQNSISVLKLGNGQFLKFVNDYSTFRKNTLEYILTCVKNNLNSSTENLLFFSDGTLKAPSVSKVGSFNDFIRQVSYYCGWFTLFGIWKSDFVKLQHIECDPLWGFLPHLFCMHDKSVYVICNEKIYNGQPVQGKGGYNLFESFCVIFPEKIYKLFHKKLISLDTLRFVKKDLFKHFCIPWYASTKLVKNTYTFDLSNIKDSMLVYYTASHYYMMILMASGYAAKINMRRLARYVVYRTIWRRKIQN
jgi:glycosyltransferase involved in cell wall biosynthesis